MTTLASQFPSPDSQGPGSPPLPFREADLLCRRLTGLPVKRASMTAGRFLNDYLTSESPSAELADGDSEAARLGGGIMWPRSGEHSRPAIWGWR